MNNPEQFDNNGEQKTVYETARPNLFQRLFNTIFAPSETFDELNRKPDWIFPLLLAVVFAVTGNLIILARLNLDWQKVATEVIEKQRAQVEQRGGTVPDVPKDVMDQQIKVTANIIRITSYVAPVVAPILLALILSLLFWGGTILMGGNTTYSRVLSVTAYITCMVSCLVQVLLATIAAFVRNPDDIDLTKGIVVTNIGGFMPDTASPVLVALLNRIDIFSIWFIILMIIGLTRISKNMSTAKSTSIVVGMWLVYVVICVALAAVFS